MPLSQPFPLTPPRPVDPAAIERGLAELWASADQAPTLGGSGAVVRSCTLNFAVVLAEQDRPSAVSDTVAALTLRHPCRIFLLDARPHERAPTVEASVSALCHVPAPGQPHICCEQISVAATGTAVDGLPHLLLALLVPDLPVVVWWRGAPPLGSHLFEQLNAVTDRTIYESAALSDVSAELPRLVAALERTAAVAPGDLTWTRLTPWRSLTAQFFDAPTTQSYLDRVDRITIEVSSTADRAAALLWLGWLASRIGWEPISGQRDGRQWRFAFNARRQVRAEVQVGAGHSPGLLQGIALEVSEAPPARFILTRCDERAVRARVEGTDVVSPERVVPLPVHDTAALLSDELDLIARDQVYESALTLAARLAAFL